MVYVSRLQSHTPNTPLLFNMTILLTQLKETRPALLQNYLRKREQTAWGGVSISDGGGREGGVLDASLEWRDGVRSDWVQVQRVIASKYVVVMWQSWMGVGLHVL